jgi:hypothetical protein
MAWWATTGLDIAGLAAVLVFACVLVLVSTFRLLMGGRLIAAAAKMIAAAAKYRHLDESNH